MRTGSPIGGGPSVRGSPASTFVCGGEPIVSKSPKDVEAARMMTRLGGSIAECDIRTSLLDGDRESMRSDGLLRFTHIKSAVMPERHSYVQRALKRKIENRMELLGQGVDCPMDANQELLLKKAIESERCNFDRVKKCRMTEYEVANSDDADVGGRFIRTGQVCRQSEDERYPKLSYLDMFSPYLEKRELVISSSGGLSFDKSTSDDNGVSKYHQIDGVKYESYRPETRGHSLMPTLSPIQTSIKVLGNGRTEKSTWPVSVNNANEQSIALRSDIRQNIPVQPTFPSNASKSESSPRQQGLLNRSEIDRQVSRNNSLSAFYSLGRHVASTLNNTPSLPVLSGPRIVNPPRCSKLAESRQQNPSVKRENQNKLYGTFRSGVVMNENKKVRLLDSRTEKKVKTGEFGTLHSLQAFYNKLESRSSPVQPKPVFRDRLGSITNCWPHQVQVHNQKNVDHKFNKSLHCSQDRVSGQETAIDLSLHSRRTQVNDIDEQILNAGSKYDREMANRFRKSRSCCSSPAIGLDLAFKSCHEPFSCAVDQKPIVDSEKSAIVLNQWTCLNPISLPSSPFATLSVVNVKREHISSPGDEAKSDKLFETDKSAKELPSSVTKADSCLPLKKRRLLDVSNDSVQVKSPQSSADTSSAGSCSPLVQLKSPSLTSAVVNCDEDGDLPLHIAIAERNCGVVEQILDIMTRLGMSLDRYNNYKQTPLHVAVITDQPTVVKRLLEGGSSPNIVDLDGLTSIHHASKLRSSSCLDCLLTYAKFPLKIDAFTYDGQTALHHAVQHHNLQAVVSLINAGARVDACDSTTGRTPLSIAVQQNDRRAIKILLAGGANASMFSYSELSSAPLTVGPHCRTRMPRALDAYVTTDVKG